MLLRGVLARLGAPALTALLDRRRLIAEVVRLVSQMRVAYADSPLSVEGNPRLAGGPRAGHRLPDATVMCSGHRVRLHGLLARPGVHVLLQRDAAYLEHLALGPHITVHRLMSAPGRGLVAVRPDGYVGFRCQIADLAQLQTWLARIGAMQPADLCQRNEADGERTPPIVHDFSRTATT